MPGPLSITLSRMLVDAQLAAVGSAGTWLADAAERAGLDAAVPTCPEWRVRDLLQHTGAVHFWATAHVRDRRESELEGELVDVVGGWPSDEDLTTWFRIQHAKLMTVLTDADRDYPYWTWRAAPTEYSFWVARMAHETTVHAMDADAAAGRRTPVPTDLAVDGVDDLVCGVVGGRSSAPDVAAPVTLSLVATDADRGWTVRLTPQRYDIATTADHDADCVVRAPAADLYRLVWHRAGAGEVDVSGNATALDAWWRNVDIRWT